LKDELEARAQFSVLSSAMCTTFDESVVGRVRHVFKVRVGEFRHVFIVDESRNSGPGGFMATIE
jgi:hypothetical protein